MTGCGRSVRPTLAQNFCPPLNCGMSFSQLSEHVRLAMGGHASLTLTVLTFPKSLR